MKVRKSIVIVTDLCREPTRFPLTRTTCNCFSKWFPFIREPALPSGVENDSNASMVCLRSVILPLIGEEVGIIKTRNVRIIGGGVGHLNNVFIFTKLVEIMSMNNL